MFLGNCSWIEKYKQKKFGFRFTVKTGVHQNENSRQRGNRKFGDGDGTHSLQTFVIPFQRRHSEMSDHKPANFIAGLRYAFADHQLFWGCD